MSLNISTAHTSLISKAIDVCEDRGDAFLIADPVPFATSNISTVVSQGKTRDTNYAAMYWPWCQVRDRQLGKLRWVPPSVIMAGIYSYNDKETKEEMTFNYHSDSCRSILDHKSLDNKDHSISDRVETIN